MGPPGDVPGGGGLREVRMGGCGAGEEGRAAGGRRRRALPLTRLGGTRRAKFPPTVVPPGPGR